MIPLRDTISREKTPVVTWMLIISNLLILLYQTMLPANVLNAFISSYGFIPADLSEVLRQDLSRDTLVILQPMVTSQFLHGGWMHVFGNMWILWLFGDNVEDYVGHIPFLLFYLVGGVFAALGHYLFNLESTIPTIGASGAVAAVMGAYFILFPKARVVTLVPLFWIPLFFRIPAVIYIGIWFISQFLLGVSEQLGPAQEGGIAWWAHIGGFLFGVLAIQLCRRKNN